MKKNCFTCKHAKDFHHNLQKCYCEEKKTKTSTHAECDDWSWNGGKKIQYKLRGEVKE